MLESAGFLRFCAPTHAFVDEEGDIDKESDVELDEKDHLDLDSEHNDDDLESDLLSDSG